jgi:hypothetical protein
MHSVSLWSPSLKYYILLLKLHYLPGTIDANEHELALARQFFDGNPQAPIAGPAFAHPQHLPPAELLRMREANGHGPNLDEAWTIDHQHYQESKQKGAWTDEYGHVPLLPSAISSAQQHNAANHSERRLRFVHS